MCTLNNVVIIYLYSFDIYIIRVYHPPSNSDVENSFLINFLMEFCHDKEVVLHGDFNLPSLKWNIDMLEYYILPVDNQFCEAFVDMGLTQVVNVPTNFPSCNILDLFLTNHPERVGSFQVIPPLPGCSHGPVLVDYIFQDTNIVEALSIRDQVIRAWARGRYDLMGQCIDDIDWYDEFFTIGAKHQYKRFLDIMYSLINRYVPHAQRHSSSGVPWSVNPPRNLLETKNAEWLNFKECRRVHGRGDTETLAAWSRFSDSNQQIKSYSVNSQRNYEGTLAQQIKKSPKLFHAYLKHRRVGRPSVGPLKMSDGTLIDDPKLMSECFANAFSEVFSSSVPSAPAPNQICTGSFDIINVSPDDVSKALRSLDSNSSMGGDNIHPRLLKSLSEQLSVPLSIIFNSSLQEGVLPDEWLLSIIVPIFKNSSRYFKLQAKCNSFEKIIVNKLMNNLNRNYILSEHQFGFRSDFSTIDQLLISYNITKYIDQGFNSVCHVIPLSKLSDIGISSQLVTWIGCFLQNRVMKVKVASALSESQPLKSGVPQGSVLGPILFLI